MIKDRFDNILMKKTSVWDTADDKKIKEIESFCEGYKAFISNSKTESETVNNIVNIARENGFIEIDEFIKSGKKLVPGDKIYKVNKEKSAVFFIIGKGSPTDGMNVVFSHTDSSRIDLKPNPLYEDRGLAFFDTHYYGSIKKYQWTSVPLSIHGVVYRRNGEKVNIIIGENNSEPVFYISDIPIHLAEEQMQKSLLSGIEGENLNILCGSRPWPNAESQEKIKLNIIKLLNEKYGIVEEDFIFAELSAVPSGNARDAGLDRSMVLAYGQDNRLSCYAAMRALLNSASCDRTSGVVLVDMEETGNYGATGVQSKFFEFVVSEIIELTEGYDNLKLNNMLRNSIMISCDAICAFDSNYPSSFDIKNSACLGNGLAIFKYTGVKGKIETNIAGAELLNNLRMTFDDENITWQSSEFGRVDGGGSETISHILGQYGAEAGDIGVPVLGMHSPYEITSKADIYELYRGLKAFYKGIR